MKIRTVHTPLALAAACALTLAAPLAHAQSAAAPATAASAAADGKPKANEGKLQTITVTAERRTASAQKTAIAMQVLSGDEAAEQALTSGIDLLKNMSDVEVQGAARGNLVAMRGIGSDMPPGMGESSVSTNYDGVYNFRAESATLGFFDLDRVEVLRGPQGTLYGRNAEAGAVNFITRDPVVGGKMGGNASLEIGSYGLIRGESGFNLPIGDKVAIRAAAAAINRKGYLSDGYDDAKSTGARVKVLFKPDERWRLLLGYEQVDLGGKGPGFVVASNWNHGSGSLVTETHNGDEKIGYQNYAATKYWAQLDVDLGIGTLTVMPAVQHGAGEVYRKWDASHRAAEQSSLDPNPASQKSVEARLASNAGSAIQWVAGVYTYDMKNTLTCLIGCGNPPESRDSTNSKAAYGQATFPVAEGWRIVAGLRHTSDKKTNVFRPSGETWSSTDGKISGEYDLTPTALGYLTYATAYRPGGFNTFNAASPRFDAEHVKSTELGLKSRWLDNSVQLNAAVFNMKYDNYQAIDNYLNPNAAGPGDPNFFLSSVYNVPKQTINGLELEAQFAPEAGGRLHVNFTYLDGKFGNLVLHDFGSGAPFSMQGLPLPHAPKTTLKAGYEYPIELAGGSLTPRIDLRYTDKQYVSISESPETLQPAYTQADLSLQYRPDSDRWGINFYVKNATNYIQKLSDSFGYLMIGAPRTVGVVLTSKF